MRCGDIVLYGNRVGVITKSKHKLALALSDGTTVPYDESKVTAVADALSVVRQFKEKICKQAQ